MSFDLFSDASTSLVKQYLSAELFNQLKDKVTATGFTLEKALQSGIINPDSAIGIYAGDAQSYQCFSSIFIPIILHYHGVNLGKKHSTDIPPVDFQPPDPEGKYIRSSRVRVARNVSGFSFSNHIALAERYRLEKQIVSVLSALSGDLKGSYCSFEHCESSQFKLLKQQQLTFEKGDRFQDAAGINRDFPKCRGIFYSADRRLRVWLNEEDHLRIISQEASADLAGLFNHLTKAILELGEKLPFARDERFGYLSSCPTNIGTSMRAGVHIQLEKLSQRKELLSSITKSHDLQIRGTQGEKTSVENNVFDISNSRRLGISEVDIITGLNEGLKALIDAEEKL